ncbi:MAG TPA: hypothetical protein VN623_11170 [Hyphomicrobium sp.]|jgi:hypothetical protein|uniref:hypothetical protein n=1 Tax=Hyphomicrobium sp. TaxID=82 RepID=UPI002C726A00|nr:hypothetical protein [Hyphomicrobium sp.]HXE02498.1 hypothetical protein [Hyphomicrobium sp.]
MTKTTLALAAALLAGTTLTSAANAGGVRVGFGFPLGSFIAHSNQSYSGEGYGSGRNCHKPRYAARRQYEAAAAPVRKIKRAPKAAVAYKVSKPEVQTAKLEDKLITNDETTTEIAKTPAADVSGTQSTASTSTTTTAVLDKETDKAATTTTPAMAKLEAPKVEKVATVEKTETSGKAEQKTISVPAAKRVCRRFSAAIAGLVDVPCQ